MQTLTPTEARKNLSDLLERAMTGENIGIVLRGQVVALRPVKVVSIDDYATSEYGIFSADKPNLSRKLHAKARTQIKSGKSKTYTGNIEDLLAD